MLMWIRKRIKKRRLLNLQKHTTTKAAMSLLRSLSDEELFDQISNAYCHGLVTGYTYAYKLHRTNRNIPRYPYSCFKNLATTKVCHWLNITCKR